MVSSTVQRYNFRQVLKQAMHVFEQEETDLLDPWACYLDLYNLVLSTDDYDKDFLEF